MRTLRLRAHAKVNLGLAVLERRPDGFHEIETLMVRIALHDVVTLAPQAEGVRLTVRGAALPSGDENLAVRAARVHFGAGDPAAGGRQAAVRGGVAITLTKSIPIAAGLGGGSSDAAAVLRGLERLAPGATSAEALAPRLGSDVPFFVANVAAAVARGRGERLEPCTLPPLALVLVDPGVPVRAADAYAALRGFGPPLAVGELVRGLARGAAGTLRNDLQAGVAARHPVVGDALGALGAAGLGGVAMSGSGSTCFGLARDAVAARAAARRIRRDHPAWRVIATTTL